MKQQKFEVACLEAARRGDADEQICKFLDPAVATDYDLQRAVTLAASCDRQIAASSREADEHDSAAIKKYSDAHTPDLRTEMNATGGCMPVASPTFVAVPPPFLGVKCAQQTKLGTVKAADELIEYCNSFTVHHSNLIKSMDQQMDHLCRLNQGVRQNESSDDDGDDVKESPCWLAGICACSPEGAVTKRFRDNILRAMKVAFPVGNFNRELLGGGKVFVELFGEPSADQLELA
eukprot:8879049-Pyramimonas_sp.AAC.1